MAVLTATYAGALAYANVNSSDNVPTYRYVVYAAHECESPTDWYAPEELGIVALRYVGDTRTLQITVDREKEPFPLQSESPIFLYKEHFYMVGSRWVTFDGPRSDWIYLDEEARAILEHENLDWQFPIGVALAVGWIICGAVIFKRRKEE